MGYVRSRIVDAQVKSLALLHIGQVLLGTISITEMAKLRNGPRLGIAKCNATAAEGKENRDSKLLHELLAQMRDQSRVPIGIYEIVLHAHSEECIVRLKIVGIC